MTASEWIAIAGIAASLFTATISSAIFLSYKIGTVHERIGTLETRVDWLETTMLEVLKIFSEMKVKLDVLWQHHLSRSNSPMVLNDAGLQAFEVSNIGNFVDRYYNDILSRISAVKPQNAYQAQEALFATVNAYKNIDECRLTLQEAAFPSGYDVDSILFVAALSMRDRIIVDLGLKKKSIAPSTSMSGNSDSQNPVSPSMRSVR